MSIKEKILSILGSIRFWIITFGAASAFAAFIDVNGFKLADLFNAIAIWLGTVAGIGTLDSIANKITNGKSKTTPEKTE